MAIQATCCRGPSHARNAELFHTDILPDRDGNARTARDSQGCALPLCPRPLSCVLSQHNVNLSSSTLSPLDPHRLLTQYMHTHCHNTKQITDLANLRLYLRHQPVLTSYVQSESSLGVDSSSSFSLPCPHPATSDLHYSSKHIGTTDATNISVQYA